MTRVCSISLKMYVYIHIFTYIITISIFTYNTIFYINKAIFCIILYERNFIYIYINIIIFIVHTFSWIMFLVCFAEKPRIP